MKLALKSAVNLNTGLILRVILIPKSLLGKKDVNIFFMRFFRALWWCPTPGTTVGPVPLEPLSTTDRSRGPATSHSTQSCRCDHNIILFIQSTVLLTDLRDTLWQHFRILGLASWICPKAVRFGVLCWVLIFLVCSCNFNFLLNSTSMAITSHIHEGFFS